MERSMKEKAIQKKWRTYCAKKRSGRFVTLLLLACLMTGCGQVQTEDETIILIEKETEELTYEMVVASVSDVKKTKKVRCTYQQVNDESLSFSVSGRRVAEVFVEVGDSVKKGQLVAQLDNGNAQSQIRTLEYNIARNELLLSDMDLNRDNEISVLWLNYIYYSGQSQGERDALTENVESIQQKYRYSREDCEDAIALDKAQLAILQNNLKNSNLYAGMDGTVSFVRKNLEGATSVKDEAVITIIDSSECLFEVTDVSLAPYFEAEDKLEMTIASGIGAGAYTLVPYDMENWGEVLLFSIDGSADGTNIEVGAMGTMYCTLEEKDRVLSVPLAAVHQADGKHYVYVLGEDNMREVKWIEAGLFGDSMVEVVSGLTEGEKVIIQ